MSGLRFRSARAENPHAITTLLVNRTDNYTNEIVINSLSGRMKKNATVEF